MVVGLELAPLLLLLVAEPEAGEAGAEVKKEATVLVGVGRSLLIGEILVRLVLLVSGIGLAQVAVVGRHVEQGLGSWLKVNVLFKL